MLFFGWRSWLCGRGFAVVPPPLGSRPSDCSIGLPLGPPLCLIRALCSSTTPLVLSLSPPPCIITMLSHTPLPALPPSLILSFLSMLLPMSLFFHFLPFPTVSLSSSTVAFPPLSLPSSCLSLVDILPLSPSLSTHPHTHTHTHYEAYSTHPSMPPLLVIPLLLFF